jgi:hypothetical protein
MHRDQVCERMTKFCGDDSWKPAACTESAQPSFFGPEIVKQDNEIVAVVRKRLKDVARFSFVPESLPMKNSANTVLRLSRSR